MYFAKPMAKASCVYWHPWPQDPAARSVVRYIETQLVVADPVTGEPTFEADQDRLARWGHVY